MLARDLMETKVITVLEDDSAEELIDLFQHAHVHGAPVVDGDGKLVGMVSMDDILIGGVGGPRAAADDPQETGQTGPRHTVAREIMTSPPISASEDTPVRDLCMMMWRLRIHHVPIVNQGKVSGMISSLDVCRAIGDGSLAP